MAARTLALSVACWLLAWWIVGSGSSPASAQSAAQTSAQLQAARNLMVETDIATAGIKTPAILAALRAVPRHEFVPFEMRQYAYYDMALPIGEHQTISPPFIVAWMTEQLAPRSTDKLLEVGTGSGYHAAVLSRLVSEVYSIEINEKLAANSKKIFERLKYRNIESKLGDGYEGWAEHAPFDKILVTCSPEKVPAALVEQLREGGRIVIPLGQRYQQTMYVLVKREGELVIESREPTFFVPMTGQAEDRRTPEVDNPLTDLGNGTFEELLEPGKPAAWYYLRQAAIRPGGATENSASCLHFKNDVPGRSSQALQALGVDGSQVSELVVELYAEGKNIKPAEKADRESGAKLLISFFDENRGPVGQQVVGPWTGSFDWRLQSGHVQVPPRARVAILGLGLMGATGEWSCDDVRIRTGNVRTVAR